MSTTKLRVIEAAVPDQEAALLKVMKANHDAGRHGIPLPKCEDCRADPDYHKKRDAAMVTREPLDEPVPVELPSGRKIMSRTPKALAEPLPKLHRVPGESVIRDNVGDVVVPVVLKRRIAETETTREAWLLRAIEALRPDFEDKLPADIRVSIGWMGGRGKKKDVIGQCWMPEAVEDQQPAIFLIPTLKDPVDILAVLVHELVHATGQRQHRASGFGKAAAKLGLTAPWTATKLSDPLKDKLTALAAKLGPFPHSKITAGTLTGKAGPRVQGTRMLKLTCGTCGYTVRTTAKWIAVGLPSCPDGDEMERDTK